MITNTLNPISARRIIIAARLIALSFLGLSLLVALGGACLHPLVRVPRLKSPGHVVAIQTTTHPHGYTEYSLVFAFNDASGITHTQNCSMGSFKFSHDVGEKVTVLYDPATPVRAKLDSFGTIWLTPLLMIAGSLIAGSFAAAWFYVFGIMAQYLQRRGAN